MDRPIRVRYAPSPTGAPHIGNIRTALFNWLFARHHGGCFILRIEDTDVARKVETAEQGIMDSLHWLGLDWDEGPEVAGDYGPYRQSERLEIYRKIAEGLVVEEKAYLCYCPPQRLAEMRAQQVREKRPPGYDRRCRNLTAAQRQEREAQGIRPVIRFKMPLEGETTFEDLIRGEVTFSHANLDDFVLLKSDGYPTYHLANVTDDHLMKVSHVLRADEWVSSTPRHILLYQALGWEPPLFAHLPIILGSDRAKLSKRHGATSVTAFREEGFLPEALVNFLALLGWSLDDKTEIMVREDLIRYFSLERVNKTAAIFSLEKLAWMNGLYIRQLQPAELRDRLIPFLDSGLPSSVPRPLSAEYVLAMVPLVQERLKRLKDVTELTDFFFLETIPHEASLLLGKQLTQEVALKGLAAAERKIEALPTFNTEALEEALRPLAGELGLKTGTFFGLLRVAVTGRTVAPPLFQSMALLGQARVLKRIGLARQKLEQT